MSDSYDLAEPLPDGPLESPPRHNVLADSDVFCIQCGYNLHGLTPERNCPECGMPIERSLRGNLLRNSSPAYLRKLHQGVFLILAAIIAQVLLIMVSFGIGIASASMAGSAPAMLQLILNILGTFVSLASLYGWWLFSSPDPAYVGREHGAAARRIVRLSVVLTAVVTVVNTPIAYFVNPGAGLGDPLMLLMMAVGLISIGVSAMLFFASMLYMRWLTPRIPDEKLFRRSKTYMWLLPILVTVGALACGIGPLIALVLYWNHFEFTRRHIKQIRREVEAEFDPARQAFERSYG